ncbi:MAG: hypothetical protein J6T38_04435 [Bacteroidaceae bacterium]|nr:hypothetical protein [Bacteroidaceae bacterium]
MKKTMMTWVLALAAILSMQAQSLEGNWQSEKQMEGVKMDYFLNFEGNQMSQSVVFTCEKEIGTVSILFSVPAQSYTPGATQLKFAFDASKTEVKFKEVKFNEASKEAIKENPSLENLMKQLVLDDFEEQKETVAKQFLFRGERTIANQTAQSFELKDSDGNTYLFKKEK